MKISSSLTVLVLFENSKLIFILFMVTTIVIPMFSSSKSVEIGTQPRHSVIRSLYPERISKGQLCGSHEPGEMWMIDFCSCKCERGGILQCKNTICESACLEERTLECCKCQHTKGDIGLATMCLFLIPAIILVAAAVILIIHNHKSSSFYTNASPASIEDNIVVVRPRSNSISNDQIPDLIDDINETELVTINNNNRHRYQYHRTRTFST